jgi:hypothetical protein
MNCYDAGDGAIDPLRGIQPGGIALVVPVPPEFARELLKFLDKYTSSLPSPACNTIPASQK